MKILAVSDRVESELYNSFDKANFPGIDLILSCGDLPPEYLSFLADRFGVPLYYVLGNHDIRFDSKPAYGCTDIHARLIQFRGINILGLEGSRWYNGGTHQYTESQMRKIIRRLRKEIWWKKGVDIIISHAPPRHIHDEEDQCHKGFRAYQRLIDHYSPRYFIHGHIHSNFTDPSERITIVKGTKVINVYGHFIFEFGNEQIDR